MEFPILIAFFAYIYYLRYLVDKRTPAEKEEEKLAAHIALYHSGRLPEAFAAFDQLIKGQTKSGIAYLYRGLCFKNMGGTAAAENDFRVAISLDNTDAMRYMELGKLLRETGRLEEALATLSTAIRVSRGHIAEPYRERATLLQMLDRHAEAEIDLASEHFILEHERKEKQALVKTARPPLLDRKMVLNAMLVVVTSAILCLTIKSASSIHLPYLAAVLLSVAIGFAEPDRGWLLAILQGIFTFIACIYLIDRPLSQGRAELEYFSLFGSILLTFAASFLGAFLKKALLTK